MYSHRPFDNGKVSLSLTFRPRNVEKTKARLITNSNGSCSSRGPFPERLGNVSGSKANFKIKTYWIVSQFLAHKPVKFASLTDSFVVSFSKLLKLWSWIQTRQTKNSFSGPKSYRDFRETGLWGRLLIPILSLFRPRTRQHRLFLDNTTTTLKKGYKQLYIFYCMRFTTSLRHTRIRSGSSRFLANLGKTPILVCGFYSQTRSRRVKQIPSFRSGQVFYLLTTIKELEREKLYIFCILWSNVFANWIFVSTGTSSSFLACFLIHSKVGGTLHNPNGITTHSHSSLQSVIF